MKPLKQTWTCLSCGAHNLPKDRECEACGQERAHRPALASASQTYTICPIDEATLKPDGFCPRGGGYPPLWDKSPFACPICRQALDWDGGCMACHGCSTGQREDWSFPGDRYEFQVERNHPQSSHWLFVARGPRPACTEAKNAEGMAQLKAILSSKLESPLPDLDARRAALRRQAQAIGESS